jgi:hypothetical protein
MCHVTHHQVTQQTLLSASKVDQPDNCSLATVSPSVGRFDQHVEPQMGSGQGNGNLVPGFDFIPCHLVSAVATPVRHATSMFSSTPFSRAVSCLSSTTLQNCAKPLQMTGCESELGIEEAN